MKFDSTNFLKDHILKILSFYNKNSFDKNGGFFNVFLNDGSIFDKENKLTIKELAKSQKHAPLAAF